MNEFCGSLKALSLRISGISTLNEMSNAMEEASAAISKVSSNLDAGKLAKLSKEMAKEDSKLEMKQELLSEVLDGIGENMDDPVEQEKLYQQVLQDCGVQLEGMVNLFYFINKIPDAGSHKIGQIDNKQINKEDDSIDQMLKNLSK